MLAWITYVPGDDLPALGGEAPAYRLSSSVSEDQVRDLADALGLEGEITQDGTEWRVSDASGTLAVADGGTATWWYSSPPSGAVTGSGSSSGSAGCAAGDGVHHRDGHCSVPGRRRLRHRAHDLDDDRLRPRRGLRRP